MEAGKAGRDKAATLADDEQVIVVVDSHSGEVRQCGNLSGHCIATNPWAAALGEGRRAPVRLRSHARDLQDREDPSSPPEPPAEANEAALAR